MIFRNARYRRRPSGKWEVRYLEIHGHNTIPRSKAGFTRKFDAQLWFKHQSESPTAATASITLSELITRFLETANSHKRPRSAVLDEITLRHFLNRAGDKPVASITPLDCESFVAFRAKSVSPWTVAREITCLNRFFQSAIRWNFATQNPAAMLKKPPTPEGDVVYLSPEEQSKFMAACKTLSSGPISQSSNYAPYLYPMVVLSLRAGLRIGEVFNLRWQNLDFTNSRITIVSGEIWQTKSGKTRVCSFDKQSQEAIQWWLAWFENQKNAITGDLKRFQNDERRRTRAEAQKAVLDKIWPAPARLVFPSMRSFSDGEQGEQMPLNNIRKSFIRAREAALPGATFTFHALRHTFAVSCAKAGVPLALLSQVLGHSDLKTTQIYLRFYPTDAADLIRIPEIK